MSKIETNHEIVGKILAEEIPVDSTGNQETQEAIREKLKRLEPHHTALWRGYVSRKSGGGWVEPYSGKFGRGYVEYSANHASTWYSFKTYWIEAGNEK